MTIQQHEEAKRRYKAINATQEEIDEASQTERGAGGYGSTGK